MARFHVSTSTPTKHEALAAWLPHQTWAPDDVTEVERIGSFHFDDPEGRVGMETHVVRAGGEILLVPLTYRDHAFDDDDTGLVGTIEHSVLGTRWLTDGTRDPRYVMLLATVALTGQGHAIGLATHDGRWYAAPSEIRLDGGGWGQTPVAVDDFELVDDDTHRVRWRNDRLELTMHRRPQPGQRPPIGLRGAWDDDEPYVFATVVPQPT